MAWTTDWQVFINDQDLTTSWSRYLISIGITDQAGTSSDSCTLDVDDAHGQVRLPQGGEKIRVMLNRVLAFEGVIDSVTSSGGRSEGRKLSVSAKGFDTAGDAKKVQGFHLDDATLGDFLAAAGAEAGFSVTVDPALASFARDYWSAEFESFLSLGERLARQYGGTFKLRGDKAVLARRGEGLSASGQALPTITARYGKNLIGWSLKPRDPRRTFAAGETRYFDRASGEVKAERVDFEGTEGVGDNVLRLAEASQTDARATLEARGRESDREAGGGTITLDLAPEARAECSVILIGARPGIDGSYRADSVSHRSDRAGGATTTISVKQPAGGAGTDAR
jgi:hypothetical protein